MLLPMQCSKSYFNLTSSQCFKDFRPASDIPHIYDEHLHVNQVLSPLLENRLLQKPPPPHSRHSSPHFRHVRAIFYSMNIFFSYLTVWRYSCHILRLENWQNILLRTFFCPEHWAGLLLCWLKISSKFHVSKKSSFYSLKVFWAGFGIDLALPKKNISWFARYILNWQKGECDDELMMSMMTLMMAITRGWWPQWRWWSRWQRCCSHMLGRGEALPASSQTS